MQSDLKPIAVKLPESDRQRLKKLGELKKRSPHMLMRDAVAQYLDREEAAERFRQETITAWQEYKDTGESVSQEDVAAWLGTWGTDDETECPACRK